MLQGLCLVPSALLHRLHDTRLESADLTFDGCPAKGFPISGSAPRLHQLAPSSADLVGRFAKFFRDGRPGGSLPAFASSYVATRIQAVTAWLLLSPPSSTRTAIDSLYSETTLAGAVRAYRVPHV